MSKSKEESSLDRLEEAITAILDQVMKSFAPDFSKDLKEMLKDVLKIQLKRPTKRPSIAKATHHERIYSKEKLVVQKPEIEQPPPCCKENQIESEDENAWQPRWDIYPEDCPEEKSPDLQPLQSIHAETRQENRCQPIRKPKLQGNYLDSQKRMKPDLLSVGTGQTVLRTNFVQEKEYDADSSNKQFSEPIPKSLSYDFQKHYIIRLFLSKEPIAGFKAALKRKRPQKREEDKRFKPRNLVQDTSQDVLLLILIKQEPPDTTIKPTLILNRFRGKFFFLHKSVNANLFFVHADRSDLRANPFKEGGDDVIPTRMDVLDQLDIVREPEVLDRGSDAPGHDTDQAPTLDPMVLLTGPMTRSRAKTLEQTLGILFIQASVQISSSQGLPNLIQASVCEGCSF